MSTNTVEELHKSIAPLAEAKVDKAKFYITTISPHNAAVMLEQKRPGHAVQPNAVRSYADAMKNGAWVLNGMPLIFGAKGELLDGVQRLQACVNADTPFQTLVAENIREDTLHTIDQHRRRSYTGVLESRHEAHPGTLMRTMSKLIRIENGTLGLPEKQISWMRYDRVLDHNPVLRQAVRVSSEQRNIVLRATARHVLVFMAYQAGHQKEMNRFLAILRGEGEPSTKEPAAVLASQLSLGITQGMEFRVDTAMAMAIMAFNDTLEGKRRKSYSWEPDWGDVPMDKRTKRPVTRRGLDEAKVPANLGMPVVLGYKGLEGARDDDFDDTAPLGEFLKQGAGDIKDMHEGQYKISPVSVTPEIANEWLSQYNIGNRKVSKAHVDAIKRDILSGNWMFNAQPICFSKTGRLLNGQHRLHGAVEADAPIDVIIVTGLEEEAFATYDIHARRTAAVDMNFGKTNARVDPRVVAAAASIIWKLERQAEGLSIFARPTASEIQATLDKHPDLPDAYPLGRKMKDVASAGIMTFVVWKTRRDRPDIADQFLSSLETGSNLEPGNPLLETRNSLLLDRNAPAGYNRTSFLYRILECWENYKLYRDDPEGYAKELRRRKKTKKAAEQLEANLVDE